MKVLCKCSSPLNTFARVLDAARRLDLQFERICIEREDPDLHAAEMDFIEPEGERAKLFLKRIVLHPDFIAGDQRG